MRPAARTANTADPREPTGACAWLTRGATRTTRKSKAPQEAPERRESKWSKGWAEPTGGLRDRSEPDGQAGNEQGPAREREREPGGQFPRPARGSDRAAQALLMAILLGHARLTNLIVTSTALPRIVGDLCRGRAPVLGGDGLQSSWRPRSHAVSTQARCRFTAGRSSFIPPIIISWPDRPCPPVADHRGT